MKKLIAAMVTAASAAAVATFVFTALAQAADVGVSISIAQPGVYGRVDIGRFPQPAVIVMQPLIIERPRVVVAQPVQPVYLWVPPGHRKNWGKHCNKYNACGMPVYFVRHDWYEQHVMAEHRRGGDDRGPGRGKGYGKGKGKGRD